jgi:hypothetical protein
MDPGKKIVGRRRSVVVDALGLLLTVTSPRPTSRTTRPARRC